jgi:hypothetical protein
MAATPHLSGLRRPYIGSTSYERLHPGDVIVPWEADRDPTLLEVCGTWTVTAVDFTPQGPCCLSAGHMTLSTDRDVRQHQHRDQPVKIIAPDRCWRLAEICARHGWHLRRSIDRLYWFACHIGADGVYRRLWPSVTNPDSHPDGKWVWGASRDGSHLGSGTGVLAACWDAVHQTTPPTRSVEATGTPTRREGEL